MEGGRGGMTVMHMIMMAPYIQTNNEELYLYKNDVTYYVITYKSAFDWVYAEQWYVIITFDVTWNPGVTHKETARSWCTHKFCPFPYNITTLTFRYIDRPCNIY